ncbi:MAG: hypothetical protein ABIR80_16700 [Opitutaceae bacterium]
MSAVSSPDNVYMEFLGPVPGVLRAPNGHYVVFWAQAAGGAGFTRPSQEERDHYTQSGKTVPEWQCEYFDFDGLAWPEAALTVDFCVGPTKLRSLCLPAREGRTAAEVLKELPELTRFIHKNGLPLSNVAPNFHEALLSAAAAAGVIQRGSTNTGPAVNPSTVSTVRQPWWLRVVRHLSRRKAA